MNDGKVDDQWHGFHEFIGVEDETWTPRKVKELLRELIKDNFIFTVDEAVLYSFLLRKGLLNLHNRHDDFFKNLAKASRTEGGKAAIIKYANSDTKTVDPPEISTLTSPTSDDSDTDEEQEIESSQSMSDITIEKEEKTMPDTVEQVLRDTLVLDSISVDEEAIQFYLNYSINRFWKQAFDDEKKTITQIEKKGKTGNKFADTAIGTFLRDYYGTRKLKLPKGYEFTNPKTKKLIEPFLMQWYIAHKLKKESYFGNFSGTGAGKTLSAILASRVIKSKMSLIICPNDVVDNWETVIMEIFPDSQVITRKDVFSAKYDDDKFQYLVLNYDKLNQESSPNDILKLIKQKIDFVVLDEIHFSKITQKEHISKRRENLDGLMSGIRKKNRDVRVLGLSATPVVNNLTEGKSLLELMTGKIYDDVSTKPTVPNAVTLFEKMTTLAIRQMPIYPEPDKQVVEVSTDVPPKKNLVQLHKRPLAIEQFLTDARIPEIIKRIEGQTIIYTEYLGTSFVKEQTIIEKICNAVNDAGFTFGLYVGNHHSGKDLFLKKQVQVLIASKPISTGVDGLQRVCNNLIFNTLPWTHALYQQIIGRIVRTGMDESKPVKIHHILASIGGFPYDQNKMNRLKYKRTLAECAVEGLLPEKNLVTPQQATREALRWLERLERGEISCVTRRELDVQLTPVEIKTRLRKFGDFSKLNRQINTEKSSSTHKRMLKNPEEWNEYHRQYREARKDWKVIPFEYWISKIKQMAPNTIIGDFGCGEAKIREAIGLRVKSFDHVAIDSDVESCDMKSVPVDSGTLNVVIFSLSLMGKDWKEYLKEAARCLSVGGYLYISETTKSLSERLSTLRDVIEENGFEIFSDSEKSDFTFIEARKI
tara:strand:+ start:1429 stop:4047 length:2619 start_codon:yes stop_codon:yes gene_type:complete